MSSRKSFVYDGMVAGSAAVANAVSGGALDSLRIDSVVIQAPTSNTNPVFIGTEANSATPLVSGGFSLTPGAAVTLDIQDLSMIWAGAAAAGERLHYLAVRTNIGNLSQHT